MEFVSDPPSYHKMKQRLRVARAANCEQGIDQNPMVFEDGYADSPEFSFLVVGDSGSVPIRIQPSTTTIAEQMVQHRDRCRFMLHTGDVFILFPASSTSVKPYREFLVAANIPNDCYDQMVKLPILPVPGNHDYYDLPLV